VGFNDATARAPAHRRCTRPRPRLPATPDHHHCRERRRGGGGVWLASGTHPRRHSGRCSIVDHGVEQFDNDVGAERFRIVRRFHSDKQCLAVAVGNSVEWEFEQRDDRDGRIVMQPAVRPNGRS